jgi:hypothetical protein
MPNRPAVLVGERFEANRERDVRARGVDAGARAADAGARRRTPGLGR